MFHADLLGRSIGGRHEPRNGARLIGLFVQILKLLGDAEVEQPHRSIALHQDVGGFQIAMNDSVLMRVLHRLANGAKQLQTLADRRIAVAAVLGERNAVDILHDEPGRPVTKGVSVIEARYGRMIQLREHALFTEEALAAGGGYPGIAQDFDGHQVAQVLAFGEVYRPHATLAQLSQDAVGAEFMGRGRRRIRTVQQIVREVGNVALQE